MKLIDGKKVSQEIKNELKEKIAKAKEVTGKIPGLVTIIVGENPASQIYVKMKNKSCAEIGMYSEKRELSESISEDELLNIIDEYNNDEKINGILVQLPLPKHIDENKVIEKISPLKDVDGFHPVSVGNLVIGKETFLSCTPYGIWELLKRYKIETKGKHVVVVGRSNIVGKPIANIMLQKAEGANSVVTICHSAAPDLSYFTKQADILIAAIGRANFITKEMVKDNVVVIDVGINRIDDPNSEKGYKIVGDVDFDEVAEKSSYITPVPGGVGPMTIAMLLQNTFTSFARKNNLSN
ncbi:MAG: bifunctional methylenetetrahydrofolate dehydrogenase/methenyltetrahydrofolate cyclohydrolase FolD [Ignavibacteriae bacterium]|jgi:methylenetetrahydrofolate dehydrogenase (NADP+)/methenyltetrahydrofolate cyclohydrolase|nr:bifunctional methylenetetrahydrofolate dehydrogenase/methenyltetrahydrofolate cyclohydrolase FolD [Ignavibacteriota bacterium]